VAKDWRDGVRVQGMMYLASGDIERVGYLNAAGLHFLTFLGTSDSGCEEKFFSFHRAMIPGS
jgi:hypothetical protein